LHPPPLVGLVCALSSDQPDRERVASRDLFRVVLWMSGALLCFSAIAVSIRALSGAFSVMEILAVRSGFGLVVLALLAAARVAIYATAF
jgi:hypothetical protein